jgi:chemotaxis signal transduction protein
VENKVGVFCESPKRFNYFVFRHGDENYGLKILEVEDILAAQEIATSVSDIPSYFHYRGLPAPIIDLRGPTTERKPNDWEYCYVVIAQTECRGERFRLCLLVERAVKVLESAEDQRTAHWDGTVIEPHPSAVRIGSINFTVLDLELFLPFSVSLKNKAEMRPGVVSNEGRALMMSGSVASGIQGGNG